MLIILAVPMLILVAGHSEDKSKTWKERKQTEVDEASKGDIRTKKWIFADKLSNMRSIKKDYDALAQLKYYKETAECYEELQRNYNKVFGV